MEEKRKKTLIAQRKIVGHQNIQDLQERKLLYRISEFSPFDPRETWPKDLSDIYQVEEKDGHSTYYAVVYNVETIGKELAKGNKPDFIYKRPDNEEPAWAVLELQQSATASNTAPDQSIAAAPPTPKKRKLAPCLNDNGTTKYPRLLKYTRPNVYFDFAARLATYRRLPKILKKFREEFAAAGFIWTSVSDEVRCFTSGCKGRMGSGNDDPWDFHALGCQFKLMCQDHRLHSKHEMREKKQGFHLDEEDPSLYAARLISFNTCDDEGLLCNEWYSPERLASAGFLWDGKKIKCFCSGCEINMTTDVHCPRRVHRRRFPLCVFNRLNGK